MVFMTRRLPSLLLSFVLLIGLLPLLPVAARAEEAGASITLAESGFLYNGAPHQPDVTSVRFGETTLSKGEYTLS